MQQPRIPDVSRVQAAFEQVLASPDFRDRSASPLLELAGAVVRWLDAFLGRWLPELGEPQIRLVSWILLLVTVGLVAFVSWRWVVGRARGRPGRERPAATPRSAPRDAAGWSAWARSEATAGRSRAAATGLYQAVILHLEVRGAVRFGAWKTPGDYAVEAGADPALREPFRSFLGHFVTVAFGPTEPTPHALDALFAGAERLGCPI